MSIWIITTGSSDVQLKIADNWGLLHGKIRSKLGTSKQFSQTKSKDNQRFLYPARAMGLVYGSAIEQHYDDLAFPLLDNFWTLLTEQNITPQRIIVLLTDQTQIFTKPADINNVFSAYWQDTCTLEPLLKRYLAEKSSATPEFLTLKPAGQSGLDNWNDVLEIVQHKLAILTDTPQDTKVYVSHQAGTPAISSAVQFASLAQFGDRVKFLVSNEQDKTLTDTVKGGSYLRGIEKEQAKTLLKHHDYSGVQDLLSNYLDSETKILLDAAIQWNFAEFGEFKDKLKEHPQFTITVEDQIKEENWWWLAYEAAYLGIVRLKQGNTVEALFHSFRSVEGLISEWARWKYPSHVKYEKDNYGKWAWFVHKTIHQVLPNYRKDKFPTNGKIKLFSQSLYDLLQEGITEAKTDHNMTIFLNDARNQRNELFHQLVGLSNLKVYEAWSIAVSEEPETKEEWEKIDQAWQQRILGCLNCVTGKTFNFLDKESSNGEIASLMPQVHNELENAIAQL
jgi:hypothetical protein